MNSEQRFDVHVTCTTCGHDNQLSVATVSLPESHALNCSVCGRTVGTLAQGRIVREGYERVPAGVR